MLAARSLSCRGEEQVLGKTLSSSKFAIKQHKNQFCLKFAPYVTGILQATCYMQKGVLGITSYMWQKSYLFNNSSFEGLAIALATWIWGAEAIMRLLPLISRGRLFLDVLVDLSPRLLTTFVSSGENGRVKGWSESAQYNRKCKSSSQFHHRGIQFYVKIIWAPMHFF